MAKIVPCSIAGKGYYCELMASYQIDHVRPHQCVQSSVIETLPGKVLPSPQEWATSFINMSLPAYFAWHSHWEMCGIQVPRFSPDNNTLRLSEKDTMGWNNRIHSVFRELQARAQTYTDVNVLLSSRTPMDQGQMGAKSSRQAGSQLKQGNGLSNHPASIWPPHMHNEEMNNGLNALSIELCYLAQPTLMGFPQSATHFCPDSLQTNL